MRTSDRRATLALVFLLGLTWLPLYLKGRTPSLWFTGSLLGGHLFALGFILFARRHPHTKPPTKDLRLLALLITLSGLVVFSGINVYQWAHFHFVGQDIATIQQALWCKLHLGTFQVSFNSLPSLDGRWHNHFGVHAHYLLLALLGPFAIWPHTLTLLLTKVVALSACALPMYLLGREYLGERGGLLAVMLWLSHPVLIGQMTFELYDLQFAPLILLSILYAFQKERYTLYLLGVGLLVLLREELAFTAMMLAPYALIMKRKRAWVWGPVGIAGAMLLLNFLILQPLFRNGESFPFTAHFGDFGSTPKEVLSFILFHPIKSLSVVFQERGLHYLFFLLQPGLLVLPLLSAELLLALPSVALCLLATQHPLAQQTHAHYSSITGAVLIIATLRGLDRLESWAQAQTWRPQQIGLWVASLLLTSSLLSGVYQSSGQLSKLLTPHPYPGAIRATLAQIPFSASVFAPRRWTPYLANRADLFIDKCPTPPDYIIKDTQTKDKWQQALYKRAQHCLSHLDQGYTLVAKKHGIELYRRIKARKSTS